MNDQGPGTDFIQAAIRKARAERLARRGEAGPVPAEPAPSPAGRPAWAALRAFTPDPRRLERQLVTTLRPGPQAKHFDMIRTRLLHQMRANGWRRVALTSPGAGCGKTMLALNLAFSFARQPDVTTMAVELDMRRPAMARMLGLRPAPQFADVLAGTAEPQDHLVRLGDTLAAGVNRRPVPEAAELLQSRQAGQILDRVEAAYAPDVMIVDMPPMLMTDDAMAFIDQVDCVLLVAAAERTAMAEITRCAEDLAARCNFLGVILNKCRFLEPGEGYADGYGY